MILICSSSELAISLLSFFMIRGFVSCCYSFVLLPKNNWQSHFSYPLFFGAYFLVVVLLSV